MFSPKTKIKFTLWNNFVYEIILPKGKIFHRVKKVEIRSSHFMGWAVFGILMLAALSSLASPQKAQAAFAEKINYQGKLTDDNSVTVADGNFNVEFKLYTQGGGGTAIWTETWSDTALWTDANPSSVSRNDSDCGGSGYTEIMYANGANESTLTAGQYLWNTTLKESTIISSVETNNNRICIYNPYSTWVYTQEFTNRIYVKSGLFSVMLGSVSSLSAVNFNQTLYLGVKIGTDAEMIPRKVIGALPAAFEAKKLGGYDWATPGAIGTSAPNSAAFTGLTASGNTTLASTAGSTMNLGNSTGAATFASGGTSAWTNTSGGLTISTAATGTLALTSVGALNLSAAAASTWTLASAVNALNFDSNTLSMDALNNRIGIGMTDPEARLEIENRSGASLSSGNHTTLGVYDNDSDTINMSGMDSYQKYSIQSRNMITGVISGLDGSLLNSYGINNLLSFDKSIQSGGTYTGIIGTTAQYNENSTHINFNDSDVLSSVNVIGTKNTIIATGDYDISNNTPFNVYGQYSDVYVNSSGDYNNSAVANIYGDWIKVEGRTYGTQNLYGLYIDSASGGADNNWAIYSAFNANSYFAGKVGIGTTGPGAMLHVDKTIQDTTPILKLTGVGSYSGSPTDSANGVGIGLVYNASGNRQFWIGDSDDGRGFRISGYVLSGWDYDNNTDADISIGTNGKNVNFPSTGNVTMTGNVGIGVTAPTGRLHIGVGTTAPGGAPLKLTTGSLLGTTEGGAIEFASGHLYFTATDSGTRYQLDQQSGGSLPSGTTNQTLYYNGSAWTATSALSNNGTNVGIGTTDPGAKLHISGGNLSVEEYIYDSMGATLSIGNNTDDIDFNIGQMFIKQSSGNVGIGVTAPTAYLNLKASTGSAGTAPIKFTTGTLLGTTEGGAIEFASGHLYFTASDAGTRYQLDQQGGGHTQNTDTGTTGTTFVVGSGSNAAATDLTLIFGGSNVETLKFDGAVNDKFSLSDSLDISGELTVYDGVMTLLGGVYYDPITPAAYSTIKSYPNQSDPDHYFSINIFPTGTSEELIGAYPNTTALMYGNVGIGVTAPSAYLNIKASTGSAGTAPLKLTTGTLLGTTEGGAIEFASGHLWFTATDSGTRYQLDQQGGATYTATNGLTLNGSAFELGGTLSKLTNIALNSNNLVFSGTGNIGIGTTAPSKLLDITTTGLGTTQTATLSLKNTSTGSIQVPPSMEFSGNIYTGAADYPIIWTMGGSNANGIGGSFVLNASIPSIAYSLNLLTAHYDGSTGLFKTAIMGLTTDNTSYALNVMNSNADSKLYVRNDGNVGIATTNPASLLHVGAGTASTNGWAPELLVSSTDGHAGLTVKNETGGQEGYMYAYADAVSVGTLTNTPLRFSTNDSTRMTILNTSGNVGIGVTDPTTRLQLPDDQYIGLGTSADAKIVWETVDANANSMRIILPEGDATNVPVMMFGDASLDNVDGGLFDGTQQPSFVIVNDDATNYSSYYHNGLYSTSSYGIAATDDIAFTSGDTLGDDIIFYVNNANTEAMRILYDGKIGIGTTAPNVKLEVLGTSEQLRLSYDGTYYAKFTTGNDSKLTLETSSGTQSMIKVGKGEAQNAGISFDGNTNDYYVGMDDTTDELLIGLGLAVGTTPYITVESNGEVGIGTQDPAYRLDVGGGSVGYDIRGYDIYSHDGGMNSFSDLRLKEIAGSFDRGLEDLMKLNPIFYHYKPGNPLGLDSQEEVIGLIAQELQLAIPEAVKTGRNGYLSVNTAPLLYTIINAVQDQQAKIAQTDASIESLVSKINNLDDQLITQKDIEELIDKKVLATEERIARAENDLADHGLRLDMLENRISDTQNISTLNLLEEKNAFESASIDLAEIEAGGMEYLKQDIENAKDDILANEKRIVGIGSDLSEIKENISVLLAEEENQINGNNLGSQDLSWMEGLTIEGPIEFQEKAAFRKMAEFFGQVLFREKVEFQKEVDFAGGINFDSSSAGYAVIQAGERSVAVIFENEYAQTPIVNASPTLFENENKEIRQATENLLLALDVNFIVTNVTRKGFEIKIQGSETWDLPFAWQAMAVKNAKTYRSEAKDISSPEELSIPAVISEEENIETEKIPADNLLSFN